MGAPHGNRNAAGPHKGGGFTRRGAGLRNRMNKSLNAIRKMQARSRKLNKNNPRYKSHGMF